MVTVQRGLVTVHQPGNKKWTGLGPGIFQKRKKTGTGPDLKALVTDRNVGPDSIGQTVPFTLDRKAASGSTTSIQKKEESRIQTWMNSCRRYNTVPFHSIRTSHVTGPIVLSKIDSYHASHVLVSDRFNRSYLYVTAKILDK
jgi:hypothetical protein